MCNNAPAALQLCVQDGQVAVALADQMTRLVRHVEDADHRACVTRAAVSLLAHQHASSQQDYTPTLCTLAESMIKVLCSLYKAGQVEQAGVLLDILEQQVGEALAALPDTCRIHSSFVQLVKATFHLLKAGLKHAPNNQNVLRGIRRTLAALPPSGDIESVEQLTSVADETATWLMRVILHSRFVPIVTRRTSSPVILPWCPEVDLPIQSIMPLVGNEDDINALRSMNPVGVEEALKAEWLTLVDTLLDMLMACQAAADKQLQEQLRALVPVLLSSYSATMSAGDRATWSLLMAIDQYMHSSTICLAPEEDHAYGVSCMVQGILRQDRGYDDCDQHTTSYHHDKIPRILSVHLEPMQIAMTIANFPDDWRMLGTQ